MGTTYNRRNRQVNVFGVEFPHISFVLGALDLPTQSLSQIEQRYGSLDSYIKRKYPKHSEQEILKILLSTPENFVRDPVKREVITILQESLREYLINHKDLNDKVCDRLYKLAYSNDFVQDLRKSLRRH